MLGKIFNIKKLLIVPKLLNTVFRSESLLVPLSINDFAIDFDHLKDPNVLKAVEKNIRERKGVGNIGRVLELKEQFDGESNIEKKKKIHEILVSEAKQLPNISHPIVETYKDRPHVLRQASQLQHLFSAKEFSQLAKTLNVLRIEATSALTGSRSYYFLDALADLEHALIALVINNLVKKKFELVSVPDVVPAEVIERCGMAVRGDRSQVYFVDEKHLKDACLSGTAEMALAGMVAGKTFHASQLPLRLVAVSRCYRSEISNLAEEKGIYRVHQFTKVEMFCVCAPEHSDAVLAEFLALEEAQFEALELDFQTLDMPSHELGAPAYRKHDIEAWFPGRRGFGELSSCSNCTDFQARRLQTRMRGPGEHDFRFVHTVNGTACAVPRTVMALLETHQQEDGSVRIPKALIPHFGGDVIRAKQGKPHLAIKSKILR